MYVLDCNFTTQMHSQTSLLF